MINTHKTVSHGFMLLQREQLTIYFLFFLFLQYLHQRHQFSAFAGPIWFPIYSPVHIQTSPLDEAAQERTRPPPFTNTCKQIGKQHSLRAQCRITHRRPKLESSSIRRLPQTKTFNPQQPLKHTASITCTPNIFQSLHAKVLAPAPPVRESKVRKSRPSRE